MKKYFVWYYYWMELQNHYYSIAMTYFNRKPQIINTLNNFNKLYYGKYNFEVIIVDDCSRDEEKLDDILHNYPFIIKYLYISENDKYMLNKEGERVKIVNSCIAFNKAFNLCSGDIIIIQNAECLHFNDIIQQIDLMNIVDHYYSTYVITTMSFEDNDYIANNLLDKDKNDVLDYIIAKNKKLSRWSGWYNRPSKTRREHLHYCSVIHRKNLDKLHGFDETYGPNYWFDDDEFLFRVKKILKTKFLENSLVIHQFHGGGSNTHNSDEINESKKINKKKLDNLLLTKENNNISWYTGGSIIYQVKTKD